VTCLNQPIIFSGVDSVTHETIRITHQVHFQFTDEERTEYRSIAQEFLRVSERRQQFTDRLLDRNMEKIMDKLTDPSLVRTNLPILNMDTNTALKITTRLIPSLKDEI
jgi:hypothetical protein